MEPMAYTAVEEPQIVALTDSSLSPFHLVLIYPARQRPVGRSIAVLPRKASAARGGSRSKGVEEHRRLAGESTRSRARGGCWEPATRHGGVWEMKAEQVAGSSWIRQGGRNG
ncbi:hypothetical protein PVAP13_1NG143900 [Panicum virgatum]|uniref:Uncharacterized protein n=1 Tax=Panicum virgatum TaxID=38727 RepID=A0A8T0WWB6_PANVG|nr:hypothetical protein PVAP13_1NG143900 [Panicum virgatum]